MKTSFSGAGNLRQRKSLPHQVPAWVKSGNLFFLTVCCAERGANQLCVEGIARAIFESVNHRQERAHWFVRLLLLMPDHLHMLAAFPPGGEMAKTVRLWKTYLARQHGVRWQRDFFDHRLRDDESWEAKADYIRQNPVRAGFVARAEDWPHVREFRG